MKTITTPEIELTLLKPSASLDQIELLCNQALQNNDTAVCVPPLFIKNTLAFLKGSGVKLATVIGFPYGYNVVEAKLAETIMAIVDGVDELNMVCNFTALKNNDWQYLARELNTILPIIRNKGKTIKLVIESSLLLPGELIKCCDIYGAAGVDYLSLSGGAASGIPSLEDVKWVRAHLADAVGIMASGISFSNEQRVEYMQAGVKRFASDFTIK
jgi:deoxyribose-phosphate aldolase